MRLSKLAAAALCAAPSLATANELMVVYGHALQNDTQLQAAGYAREVSLETRPQARALLLPQLSGAYSYALSESDGTQQQLVPAGDVDPTTGEPVFVYSGVGYDQSASQRQLSVTLQQAIFDWGAFARLGQSVKQLALADVTFRSAEQALIQRTASAYFDALAAADDLRYTVAEKASLERQLEESMRRFEVGLSAITDVQEAQARYDSTTAQVIQAEQALEASRLALSQIVGNNDTPLVPLQDEIPLPAPTPADVNAWVSSALNDNFDLAAARLQSEIAGRDIAIARAGHYPTLGLQGTYDKSDSEVDDRDGDQTDKTIALSLNVPIFSGGLVRSQVRAAQATYQQRLAEQEGSRRAVEVQTRNAFIGVNAGAANVRALKQAVISNQTALDASRTGLEVGTRTSVDVLNAQSLLFSAQRDYARARYDYLISILNLKAAAGRLRERDLAEIDRFLVGGQEAPAVLQP